MIPQTPGRHFSNLVEILRYRAQHQPDKTAYTFLQDGEIESSSLTYQKLDCFSRAIAAQLQSLGATNERALLLYPPGLEFIAAFFGCLYAGAVAVPAYYPRPNRSVSRLEAIVASSQATVALTTTSELVNLESRLAQNPKFAAIRWLSTDNLNDLASGWQELAISSHTLAFLQYTSGSTESPKGVMVSHGNLLHNQQMVKMAFGHTDKTIFAGWLPLFHDMGLIGNVLQPLYLGIPCILMSPVAFLQKPFSWLKAISCYKATTSGGPNFAYDLCVRKITPEQRASLDLSSWEVAFNGAEPVRAETLQEFAHTFADCGFRIEAFYPCYGMAEATLFVSGGLKTALPVVSQIEGVALSQNPVVATIGEQENVRTIVGCGRTWLDQKITIVALESLTVCPDGKVGEIWVSGSSVAQGYWNRTEETKQAFHALIADTNEGPFLRTGDLGFLLEGELFVTGRLKDLIIIRGLNYYPQDIELTVEQSHPALLAGGGAAFSIEVEGEERLVVAQEVERSYLRQLNVDEVVRTIRKAVSQQHELQVYAILLLKTGSIPKTSSGKIQRHEARAGFLAQSLPIIHSSILDCINNSIEGNTIIEATSPTTTEIQRQLSLELNLRDALARLMGMAPAQLNPQQPLNTLGLDSLKAVEIKNYIEANFGLVLPMEIFLEDVSITQLATQILCDPKLRTVLQTTAGAQTSRKAGESVHPDKQPLPDSSTQFQTPAKKGMQFSLFYFSSNEADTDNKYQLLIEGAKFADQNGFAAVWIPERHFHPFGGIYPNPSVLGAALAMVTERIRLRAGSVVLPLHNPIRVAEEWSVVDNLSRGRVDIAFARGWNPNDFVISPETYANRTEVMFSGIQTIHKLWRGESILLPNGVGKETEIKIHPLPQQRKLPTWITCSGGRERFIEAGTFGANILTALLFQPIEELAEKIALYREARSIHGHAPEAGCVTLMLHTFIGEDMAVVRNKVQRPFIEYLKTSVDLWRGRSKSLDDLTHKEQEDLLAYAFERYFQTSALFGTPNTCLKMVARLLEIGVDEIACLIDFGVDVDSVMTSLYSLKRLKDDSNLDINLDMRQQVESQHSKINISDKIERAKAEQLLATIDRLSDREVDSLLSELLAAQEVSK